MKSLRDRHGREFPLYVWQTGSVIRTHRNMSEVLANRASLLLDGMGPLWDPPSRVGGKVFAGIHALYAGLVFVVAAGLVCVPVLYRLWQKYRRDEAA